MMRKLCAAWLIFLATWVAFALEYPQSFEEYMKLRKKYGITQASGIPALETLIGSRILEVKGVVKGAIRSGDTTTLLLDASDGSDLYVEATSPPDWLTQNQIPARLLVRASRTTEGARLNAELLGAASDQMVAATEPKPAVTKFSATPPSAKGNPLSGPIGRTKSTKNWNLPTSDALPYYKAFIQRRNPRLSDAEATRISQGIIGFSIQYGVDARLVMAMVLVESGFNPNSTSRSGAMGLGQLMPGTAKGMGVSNAYDSIENLYATVRIIRGHLDKYSKQTGDEYEGLVLALAAYNAGSGAVRKHGGVPPYRETQNHIRKVIGVYRALCGS